MTNVLSKVPNVCDLGLEKTADHKTELKRRLDNKFRPGTKTLPRILKIILERNSIGRTALSMKANINYALLSRHLAWMENKSLIKLSVENGKVTVKLTLHGREFATEFCDLLDVQNDQFD